MGRATPPRPQQPQPSNQQIVYVDARHESIPSGTLKSVVTLQFICTILILILMSRSPNATPNLFLPIVGGLMIVWGVGLFLQWVVYKVYWGCITFFWLIFTAMLACTVITMAAGYSVNLPRVTFP